MYNVVIVAAGKGDRFGKAKGLPKQYLKIQEKTILEHSLLKFVLKSWVNHIVVVIAEDDMHFPTLSWANHPKITAVLGGSERMISVKNALNYFKKNTFPSWVLVHDAVRPCVHSSDLEKLVKELKNHAVGGVLATKVADTIKLADDNNDIIRTLSREGLWQVSTPQMFRLSLLEQALSYCIENNIAVTDEASAMEQCGFFPKIVKAGFPNPKLTVEQDFFYIEQLLKMSVEFS